MRGRGGRGRPRRDTGRGGRGGRGRPRRTRTEPDPPPLRQGEDTNLVARPPLDNSNLVHELSVQQDTTRRQHTSRRRGRSQTTVHASAHLPQVHERRVRTRNSSNLAQGESISTPSNAPSIRDTARIASVSSGSQHSQGSEQSSYNVRYFQHRQQLNDHDTDNDSTDTDDELSRTNLDSTRINHRICICDRQLYPTDCTNCNVSSNTTCVQHQHITCTHNPCQKKFH